MCETSNLETFSAEHLSLLIECIDYKIESIKAVNAMTGLFIAQDDISERLEIALRNQNSNRSSKVDDLYGLRVCIMNAHQIVRKRGKMLQN